MTKKILLILVLICLDSMSWINASEIWGFYAHKEINRIAITTLPPPLSIFYKANREFIINHAINPDKRRYIVKNEGPKHFIDLDNYPDSLRHIKLPYYSEIQKQFEEEFLDENGILPWNMVMVKHRLTEAFSNKDYARILRLSSEAGHYIGDANVPLHTTSNYNGQQTNQHGIHGFWESRLPELFLPEIVLLTGKAEYIPNFPNHLWQHIKIANNAVDSVLLFEKELSRTISSDKKYGYEKRGNSFVRTYSKRFSTKYYKMLNGMIERQLKRSIKLTGDFWYTCWVDAGKPNLINYQFEKYMKDSIKNKIFSGRGH